MPNAQSLAAIAQMHLIQTVDDSRTKGDPFTLPAWLRTQLDDDLATLETADASTALTESNRAGSSATARAALDSLADLLREGYNFIVAIRAANITDAQRIEVFASYGWVGGKLGRFGDARTIGLARLAVADHSDIDADFQYPADLLKDITAQLKTFDASADAATGGDRATATKIRDAALADASVTLAQVRFYYCSASRDIDQTPQLSRINFQPRRDFGTLPKPAPQPPPAPPAGGAK